MKFEIGFRRQEQTRNLLSCKLEVLILHVSTLIRDDLPNTVSLHLGSISREDWCLCFPERILFQKLSETGHLNRISRISSNKTVKLGLQWFGFCHGR